MSECTQLPTDSPIMRAWSAYKATPEYANSRSWAKHSEHVDGSLWASFMTGWEACGEEQLRAEVERLRNDLADALDCKNGVGPTALSLVIDERDSLRSELAASRVREARMRGALDEIAWGRAPGPLNNKLAQKYEQVAAAALDEGAQG